MQITPPTGGRKEKKTKYRPKIQSFLIDANNEMVQLC